MVIYVHTHVDAIHDYESKQLVPQCHNTTSDYRTLCTGGIFATYPKDFLTLGTGFFDQVCQYSYNSTYIHTDIYVIIDAFYSGEGEEDGGGGGGGGKLPLYSKRPKRAKIRYGIGP